MRSRVVLFLIVLASLVFGLIFARQAYVTRNMDRSALQTGKKLRVLTYATFVSSGGPGGEIIKRFEQETGYDVETVSAGDAGLLLERLKLGQAGAPFDVVIGLDQLMIEAAERDFTWRELPFATIARHPSLKDYANSRFVPFDFSPLTFVYRRDDKPVPKSFAELTSPEFKGQFTIQDPRSSSPGMQFYNWVRTLEGSKSADFLKRFQPNVKAISPSWSYAYGQFKQEQTRFVFSYLTSLAFHWGYENDQRFQVLEFAEGHPLQIELMAVPTTCRECDAAEKFVQTMLQPWAQTLIMQKNFMFAAIDGLESGTVFETLPRLKVLPTSTTKDLSAWDQVFKR